MIGANQTEELKPIENEHIIRSGRLKVGGGHELYWVDWGNPNVTNPIFYIHGGPGVGIRESQFDYFDPARHRVVFHDQRGSSRSTPFASIENNTTQDLIEDITKLRNELGFEKISLYGFSWGSTLSLMYAINHPEVVEKMLIGSIYLSRKVDNDFYLNGGIASHFPEVWERFIVPVPEGERSNVGAYYRSKLFGSDEAERKRFAKEWMLYEASTMKLDYHPTAVERELKDFASESLAYLEAHYIFNNCFIEEDFIIKNAGKLRGKEIVILHGRYDFICMPSAAYDLKRAIGDSARLHIVMAGHSGRDTVQRETGHAYVEMLWPGQIDS